MEKINFRGKERTLLEARLYCLGLRYGFIDSNLMENEKEDYLIWREREQRRREIARNQIGGDIEKIIKEPTERRYLIKELENRIKSAKYSKKKN